MASMKVDNCAVLADKCVVLGNKRVNPRKYIQKA